MFFSEFKTKENTVMYAFDCTITYIYCIHQSEILALIPSIYLFNFHTVLNAQDLKD